MRLDVRGLRVDIGGATLVRDLDLTVPDGEVVGIVGPNGCGKSTTLRCLYRALRPSGGVIMVDDEDLLRLSVREGARRVAALTQDGDVDLDFTVAEVVALGRTPHRRRGRGLDRRELDLCEATMRRLDVWHLRDRGILSLSGGERQRVLVARALVQEPRVLVLDEPLNHLDLAHQIDLLATLRAWPGTVLVVLHDLNLAAAVCDRIHVLARGRTVASGTPREVLTPTTIAAVFGVEVTVIDHPVDGHPLVLPHLPSKGTP